MDEGEEGMILSEDDKSKGDESHGDTDDVEGNNPTEKQLLEKYEKYPDYLRLTLKKPQAFFENLEPFSSSNRHSLTKLLSKKSKEQLVEQLFPLTLYIQLVPELNILTVMVSSGNDAMTTDALLTDLLGDSD